MLEQVGTALIHLHFHHDRLPFAFSPLRQPRAQPLGGGERLLRLADGRIGDLLGPARRGLRLVGGGEGGLGDGELLLGGRVLAVQLIE